MAIFDSFNLPNADSVISGIKNAATASISSLMPGSNSIGLPSNGSTSGNAGYYKVYIVAKLPSNDEMRIVADGPTDFSFSTSLTYESPYQDLGEKLTDKLAGQLGPAGDAAKALIHGSGTRMFTQALTAKVWSGASETTISLPLILQAEDDVEKDVLTPLMQLMFLSMPREANEGGFLSGPGPVFDWSETTQPKPNNPAAYVNSDQSGGLFDLIGSSVANVGSTMADATKDLANLNASKAAGTIKSGVDSTLTGISSALKKMVKYPISLQIGNGFRLDNVVIESVTQTHKLQPVGGAYNKSTGVNSRVQIEVMFKTFYTLTQRDIAKMLLPMSISGSKTMQQYKKHLGAG